MKQHVRAALMLPCCSEENLTDTDVSVSGSAVSGSPATAAATSAENDEDLDRTLRLPEVMQQHFQLSTSAAQNQLLRSEFYYEQVATPTLRTDSTATSCF